MAFSLEHEPHIIVLTAFSPGGAMLHDVFFLKKKKSKKEREEKPCRWCWNKNVGRINLIPQQRALQARAPLGVGHGSERRAVGNDADVLWVRLWVNRKKKRKKKKEEEEENRMRRRGESKRKKKRKKRRRRIIGWERTRQPKPERHKCGY